jgi:hypothetical protein
VVPILGIEELDDPSREFGQVLCLEAPEAAPVPQSLRRTDGRSGYQRHGGIKITTRVQLSREEQIATHAGSRGGPSMSREDAARALGATAAELTAALHEQREAETRTAAGGLRMDQAAAAFHVLTSDRRIEVVGPAARRTPRPDPGQPRRRQRASRYHSHTHRRRMPRGA